MTMPNWAMPVVAYLGEAREREVTVQPVGPWLRRGPGAVLRVPRHRLVGLRGAGDSRVPMRRRQGQRQGDDLDLSSGSWE
jgi:hypothetical protein